MHELLQASVFCMVKLIQTIAEDDIPWKLPQQTLDVEIS